MKEIQRLTYVGLTLILLYFVPLSMKGQKKSSYSSDKRNYNKALNLIESGDYHLAIQKLNEVLISDSSNLDVLYYLGYCYLNTSDVPDTAAIYFKDGIEKLSTEETYSDIGIDLRLALAETDQVLLKPDEALMLYEELKANVPESDAELHKLIDHKINVCRNAKIYLNNSVEITVTNLGPEVNSSYDDHSPLVTVKNNLLIFTSRRPTRKAAKLKDGQYPEKIFYSKKVDGKWSKAKMLQMFYKKYDHESAASVSADGSELFIFHNDTEGKSIYVSYFDGNEWNTPKKLPSPINSRADETHASLSADKSTLFFTSNREGGFGGLDIYMSKLNANGKWGNPKNLGPNINSEFDEDTPMLHPDGKTLYFSSEGHNSMGRMDVFYSEMKPDSTWTAPVNLGYPINTPDDDFFFVPTINKSEAYYASSRFEDNYGGADIYNVKFKDNFSGNLAVIEGVIKKDGDTPIEKIRILVTDLDNNRLVGDYRPDPKTGTYLMFLETGNLYEIKQVLGANREKIEHLDVREEMVFEKLDDVLLFKEVTITPPMIPALARIESDSKQIEQQIKLITAKHVMSSGNRNQNHGQYQDQYRYVVQILALKHKPLFAYLYFRELEANRIKSYKCTDDYTRYIYGFYDGFKAAKKAMVEIQKTGKFQDAFVRDYSDIEQLSTTPVDGFNENGVQKLNVPE